MPGSGGKQDTAAWICVTGVDRCEEERQRGGYSHESENSSDTHPQNCPSESAHRAKIANYKPSEVSLVAAPPPLGVVLDVTAHDFTIDPVDKYEATLDGR